ncbi:MAG: hypothetical protein ACRBBS_06820 [Thalassovita sp.]
MSLPPVAPRGKSGVILSKKQGARDKAVGRRVIASLPLGLGIGEGGAKLGPERILPG